MSKNLPVCECEHIIFDHVYEDEGYWGGCLHCDCEIFVEDLGD